MKEIPFNAIIDHLMYNTSLKKLILLTLILEDKHGLNLLERSFLVLLGNEWFYSTVSDRTIQMGDNTNRLLGLSKG